MDKDNLYLLLQDYFDIRLEELKDKNTVLFEMNMIFDDFKKNIKENYQEKCCICGKPIEGFGNNPYPIKKEGKCCDDCNLGVIRERIRRANLV